MAPPPPPPPRVDEKSNEPERQEEEDSVAGNLANNVGKKKDQAKNKLNQAVSSAKWYVSKDHTAEGPDSSTHPETKSFGLRPQKAFCKHCGKENMTTISHIIGRGTIIAAAATFFIFPGITACLLKSNVCKDVEHKCSVCGRKLGKKKKLPC